MCFKRWLGHIKPLRGFLLLCPPRPRDQGQTRRGCRWCCSLRPGPLLPPAALCLNLKRYLDLAPRSAEQTLINDSLLPGGDKPLPMCLWRPQRPLPAARRAGLPRPARRYRQHVLLEQQGQGGLGACFNNKYFKK